MSGRESLSSAAGRLNKCRSTSAACLFSVLDGEKGLSRWRLNAYGLGSGASDLGDANPEHLDGEGQRQDSEEKFLAWQSWLRVRLLPSFALRPVGGSRRSPGRGREPERARERARQPEAGRWSHTVSRGSSLGSFQITTSFPPGRGS